MFPDFRDLIALLNKHKVKYLVVGGYAVARHAQPRATKALDILIQLAPKNATAVYAALAEFGPPLLTRTEPGGDARIPARRLTAKDFEDGGTWYTMGVPPVAIDILPEISGVKFSAAWKNRATLVVDEATGLAAHFISRADLITAKLAAGRPRDLADVDELQKAAAKATGPPDTASAKPRRGRKK
jgi:hypothetical protein